MHPVASNFPASKRCHALDWLRVLALLSVFLLHNLRFFDFIPWHVKNEEQSELIMQLVLFRITWGMPLLFLIAGAASAWAARNRSYSELLVARLLRLGVPFAVGAFVLVPPQRWIEARHHGGFEGSLAEYLPVDFARLLSADLGFSPQWFGYLGLHLWFLGFLLLYGIFGAPILAVLARRHERVESLARWAEKPGGLLIFVVPLLAVQLNLSPRFPGYLDWADFCRYFLFFAFGYLWTLDDRFFESAKRDVAWMALLGLAGLIFQLWASLSADLMAELMASPNGAPFWPLYQLWIAISSFVWPVIFLGLALRYLDFPSRSLSYLNEAGLPFYALHQTVILAVGVYVVETDLPISAKLAIITSISFGVIALLYEGAIRRQAFFRRLLGMKPKYGRVMGSGLTLSGASQNSNS